MNKIIRDLCGECDASFCWLGTGVEDGLVGGAQDGQGGGGEGGQGAGELGGQGGDELGGQAASGPGGQAEPRTGNWSRRHTWTDECRSPCPVGESRGS